MVNSQAGTLDRTFAALSDPTRRQLLAALTRRPHTVGDLAADLPMSLVAVGKHLTVLERAGLIARTRAGRTVVCTPRPGALAEAADWLASYRRFWDDRLDALHNHLTTQSGDAGLGETESS